MRYVLLVTEEDEYLKKSTRGLCILETVKKYNLKSALFNLAASWKELQRLTLANGWKKKMLYNLDTELDLEGFESSDFHHTFQLGETEVTEEDVKAWLEENGNPGYQM